MSSTNDKRVDDAVQTFPGRTITLELSAAQVAYFRYLLFRDLHEEAEALVQHAHGAHENGGPVHGDDARDTFRGLLGVTAGLLDLIGWETDEDVDGINWLAQQARERMTGYELTAVERREGEDRG